MDYEVHCDGTYVRDGEDVGIHTYGESLGRRLLPVDKTICYGKNG